MVRTLMLQVMVNPLVSADGPPNTRTLSGVFRAGFFDEEWIVQSNEGK